MVLELVYSDDERRVAQSMSKQIWDILYKDTVAPDVMQIEGGEDDIPERENPLDEDDSHHSMDSNDSSQSHQDDSVHETPPEGREMGYDEGVSQEEVVGDTSAVGIEDYLGYVHSLRLLKQLYSSS